MLGDRFLNGFTVKMVHRGFAPWDRLNYMMVFQRLFEDASDSASESEHESERSQASD